MDGTNHSNCSDFEEILEQHFCSMEDLKQAVEALIEDPENEVAKLALSQASKAEFALRNRVISYRPTTEAERKKQHIQLAACLIACNRTLDKPLYEPTDCSGMATLVEDPDQ